MSEQPDWQILEAQVGPEEGDVFTLETDGRFTLSRYQGGQWEQVGGDHNATDIEILVRPLQFLGESKGRRRYYRPTGKAIDQAHEDWANDE
jgi:hypothetical protein